MSRTQIRRLCLMRTSLTSQRKSCRKPRQRLKLQKPVLIAVITQGTISAIDLGDENLLHVDVAAGFRGALGHDEDSVVVSGQPGDLLVVVVVDHATAHCVGGFACSQQVSILSRRTLYDGLILTYPSIKERHLIQCLDQTSAMQCSAEPK